MAKAHAHPLRQRRVTVDATIEHKDRATSHVAAADAVRNGTLMKVKVSVGDDVQRLVASAVCAVRPCPRCHVDTRDGALGRAGRGTGALRRSRSRASSSARTVHGVEALRAVAAEIARADRDGQNTHATHGTTELVCLKISRGRHLRRPRGRPQARAAGSSVYLTSTLNKPTGIAAGVPRAGLRAR